MSFNYPQFLWALAALAIPILIHLFNFRRTTRIFFSNTRFLKQVQQETTQKRKLKRYLILASRLLFLFFLVLAFAQPFLPAREQLTSQHNLVIYLDNSYSMSAPVQEKTRGLDAAIAYVREIAELFPAETRFKLITNDFAPFSNSFKSKAEILDQLSQIRFSSTARTATEIIKRIGDANNTVFWISDFQQSTFGEPLVLDSAWNIRLVPVAFNAISNVYVDSVYLTNPFIIGGEKNSIQVRLRNSGSKAIEGLVSRLSINGVQAATSSITIQPNSSAETLFDLSRGLQGNNKAVFSFSDFPVSFDNEFFFTLNYTGRLRVVELKSQPGITHVEQVYGNKQLFDLKSYTTANVDYSAFADANLLVLNGINQIDQPLGTALRQYLDNQGVLLVFPGTEPDVKSYQNLLALPMLTKTNGGISMPMNKPDFSNPFFENVFEERSASVAMPSAQKIWDWGPDRSAVLSFQNGQPYLSKLNNIFIAASPLSIASTDFATHALFVPVMYRVAATGNRQDNKPYHYLSSGLVSVAADSLVGEEPVRMLGEQEIVPAQRKTGNKVLLELPRYSITPGFYYVTHQRDTLELVAFNLEKNESELAAFTEAEIQTAFGGSRVSVFDADSPEAFSIEIKARYLGTPLWKYALVLALVFLLVEVLLIRFLK
ncbi:MAG TPA: BatA and WFA domain-containing protein [Cyclobacteriaceae bacterium]|nr:BatA and WFA domain-containing protein [Cyclobacteriaceae bacterium]